MPGTDKKLPQIARMADLLGRGIAVHHGGLLPIVKEVWPTPSSDLLCLTFWGRR